MTGTAGPRGKLFLSLSNGRCVFEMSLLSLVNTSLLDGIVVATKSEHIHEVRRICEDHASGLDIEVIAGGRDRQESVFYALQEIRSRASYVLIHDAARPFCDVQAVKSVYAKCLETKAAILAVPVSSTLKQSQSGGLITSTVPREGLWAAQTPQAFSFELIYEAHRRADEEGYRGTDDSQLAERLGYQPAIVCGSPRNIKITTAEDLRLGNALLALNS